MKLSKHAAARRNQRGFHNSDIDLILSLGRTETAPGGAVRYKLRRKDIEKIRKSVDRISQGATLVVGNDGEIKTMYKRYR